MKSKILRYLMRWVPFYVLHGDAAIMLVGNGMNLGQYKCKFSKLRLFKLRVRKN